MAESRQAVGAGMSQMHRSARAERLYAILGRAVAFAAGFEVDCQVLGGIVCRRRRAKTLFDFSDERTRHEFIKGTPKEAIS
jgi:hypothetical protein